MVSISMEQFDIELRALITKWNEKPLDDKLTWGEFIGVIECLKLDLIREHHDKADRRV